MMRSVLFGDIVQWTVVIPPHCLSCGCTRIEK